MQRVAMTAGSLGLLKGMLAIAGCQTQSPNQASGSPAAGSQSPGAAETLRVGAVLPGAITDAAWNQSAYEGLTKAQKDLGIEFAYVENVAEPDQPAAMRDYAQRGYNIVIGHGGEFQEPAEQLAKQFPDVLFLVSSGTTPSTNLATLNFNYRQIGYVLGHLAGKMTKSGTVGWLGALEIKFSTELVDGYQKGAEAARPGTKVLVTYMGDWNDVAKGKEAALAQIGDGADIIFPTMDKASVGSLTAAKEAGHYGFGIYYDALSDWPDTVLQSAIMDVNAALVAFLTDAKAGKAAGKDYVYGLESPAASFASYNPKVPQAVVAETDKLIADFAAGKGPKLV
jgi:basic membrane protein A